MGDFQKNLKKCREEAGYEQAKDFAAEIGIPYTTYIAYESKGVEPKFDTLLKIAATLHVSTDTLLGYDQQEEGSPYEAMKRKFLAVMGGMMKLEEKKGGLVFIVDSKGEEVISFGRPQEFVSAIRLCIEIAEKQKEATERTAFHSTLKLLHDIETGKARSGE